VRGLHAAHLLAMSVWVGGVLAIVTTRPLTVALARRFTPAALGSVAVLAGTGLLMAGEHLRSPAQWTGTLYGQTLLVKVNLVALALGAAILVRRAFAARSPQARVALAREQFRRDREVAELGEAADDVLDVLVHAEDLLHHEHHRKPPARRRHGAVGRDFPVRHRDLHLAGGEALAARRDHGVGAHRQRFRGKLLAPG
jgi:uncharacterized membrane protein